MIFSIVGILDGQKLYNSGFSIFPARSKRRQPIGVPSAVAGAGRLPGCRCYHIAAVEGFAPSLSQLKTVNYSSTRRWTARPSWSSPRATTSCLSSSAWEQPTTSSRTAFLDRALLRRATSTATARHMEATLAKLVLQVPMAQAWEATALLLLDETSPKQ